MRKIYLDYSATTPCDPLVIESMNECWGQKFGNSSSFHSYGREARSTLDQSREVIATAIGAHPSELFFVSGGTEANNYALQGISRDKIKHGKNHIITSSMEHSSVLKTCSFLENQGFIVTYLSVGKDGLIDPMEIKKAINQKTGLISIMHVNNETGVINPIENISKIAKENNILLFSDSVQSFGKIPIDVNKLGVDLLSLSAHKIYGPKGIGAIYIRQGVIIDNLIHGGEQERGRRAGTESVALAVGFAKAVQISNQLYEDRLNSISRLSGKMARLLRERFNYIMINGEKAGTIPHIINVSFGSDKIEIDGEALLFNLDLAGIAVTSGSACSSGTLKASHVLTAMGRNEATARASLRISLGNETTIDDITYFVDSLTEIVKRIGKIL